MKFNCPCCNYKTLNEKPTGTFQVCPVCYWEDDNIQFNNPDFKGGANDINLNIAKENFRKIGAIEEKYLNFVRPPLDSEK